MAMMAVAARSSSPDRGSGQAAHRQRPARVVPAPNPVWAGLALGGRMPVAVSQPGDASEREADRIADSVMRMPAAGAPDMTRVLHVPDTVQRACAACEAAGAPCPGCAEEADATPVHLKTDGTGERPAPSLAGPLGAGAPLDRATRDWFEPRLATDLGAVRVHADGAGHDAASRLAAHAFTIGSHIAFARGRYDPDSSAGRRLLAHELVHVLQGGQQARRSAVPGIYPAPAGEGETPGVVPLPVTRPSGPPPVPSPETCPPPEEMVCPPATTSPGAVTNELIFPQDSAALTPLQRAEIDAAAAAWHTMGGGVVVRVDGFASAEGDCSYNWDLSCRRARAVAGELTAPSDGTLGVPSADLELFAQGESDTAGRALALNRRATISIPIPPPPPPPPPCVFPVLLGSARGCAGGPDFGHHDYPPNTLSTSSALKLTAWALGHSPARPSRHLVTDLECELEMDAVLFALAGTAGHRAFARFAAGTGGTETHGNSSTLGAMALLSGSFLATVAAVQLIIESQLAAQAASGALDPCALSVTPPTTFFSASDGTALKAVLGGTQGEQLFATGFTGNVATRTYTIDLRFVICDDFGVDESDLYAPGLFPFWVLQHERSATAYAPFVNELDLTVSVSGTF